MQLSIPYGSGCLSCDIPSEQLINSTGGAPPVGIPDVVGAVRIALENPIGSGCLYDICRPGSTVSIVVNDITRPILTDKMIPPILSSLHHAGVKDRNVSIVIATGIHRPATASEQKKLLGELPEDIKIVNHLSKDHSSLTHRGYTTRGTPVIVNKVVAEADVKILTGLISPHQQAGFSGGRKSVLPGIASYRTIKDFHSAPLNSRTVSIGKLDGNLTHQESLEAARLTQIDFIVNVVHSNEKGVLKVVAGDLEKAWMDGVRFWREKMEVKLTELADIAIVSPGGYPRDINLWQSQKAIASAELITKKGGTIILVAQCLEGLGEDHLNWQKLLVEANTPIEAMEKFEKEGYEDGSGKAYTFARASQNYRVIVVSEYLDEKLLNSMFMEQAPSIEKAIEMAATSFGDQCKIVVLQEAVEYLPSVIPEQR